MIRSMDIDDIYKAGQYLRQWLLVDGFPKCNVDAVPVADQDQADIDVPILANAAVRQSLSNLEWYEAAVKLQSQDEPQRLLDLVDIDGNKSQTTNPKWQAWEDARAIVAAVSDETLALILLRKGEPVT